MYLNIALIILNEEKRKHLAHYIECLLYISKKTKQSISKIKKILFDIILTDKYPEYIRVQILRLVFQNDYFSKKELTPISNLILNWIHLKSAGNFFL